MKLLIDQNISHRIVPLIAQESWDLFHVNDLGLRNADDHEIFKYARQYEFAAVITNDDDFVKLLNLFSSPPKIIWLRTGNCSTEYLAEILSEKIESINEFLESEDFTLYEVLRRSI